MKPQPFAIQSGQHFLRFSALTFPVHKAVRPAAAGNADVEAFACANRVVTRICQRVTVLQCLQLVARRWLENQLYWFRCVAFSRRGSSAKLGNVLRSFLRFEFICVHRFLQSTGLTRQSSGRRIGALELSGGKTHGQRHCFVCHVSSFRAAWRSMYDASTSASGVKSQYRSVATALPACSQPSTSIAFVTA